MQTALAFLLGGSAEERKAIDAEVGLLYSARSKLVHGKHFEDRGALHQLRQRALEIALECLRMLFSTHHELIADDARGKRVILAAGRLEPTDSQRVAREN